MVNIMKLAGMVFAMCGLSSAAALHKRDSVVIGYRTVNKIEGRRINDAGWLFYDSRFDFKQQLGRGKSLSGDPGSWDIGNDNMYCIVYADEGYLGEHKKAWIPQYFDGGELWWADEGVITSYINSGEVADESPDWDASRTLRFAQVQGKSYDECFLPNNVLGEENGGNGPLYLYAACYETVEAMKAEHATPALDYNTWGVNGPKTDPTEQ